MATQAEGRASLSVHQTAFEFNLWELGERDAEPPFRISCSKPVLSITVTHCEAVFHLSYGQTRRGSRTYFDETPLLEHSGWTSHLPWA